MSPTCHSSHHTGRHSLQGPHLYGTSSYFSRYSFIWASDTLRSPSVKSYRMFHPSAPNLRRSCAGRARQTWHQITSLLAVNIMRLQHRVHDKYMLGAWVPLSEPPARPTCMTAWNKHMPSSRRRHSRGLVHPARSASLSLLYCRSRLARSPAGGSSVILTPSCSRLTGKEGLGMLVSHSRKSLCTCEGSGE
jgi:hypothetical protein